MKKIIASILILSALSGCATFGQMEEGLNGLIGQNINTAISVLGFPSSERGIAGMRLVEWGRSTSGTFMMPTTTSTTGYAQSGTRATTFAATTTSSVPVSVNYQCYIALQVDANNIIRRYQYEGNLGGCTPYIRALKQRTDNMAALTPAQRKMME